jgi:hypothetical protein
MRMMRTSVPIPMYMPLPWFAQHSGEKMSTATILKPPATEFSRTAGVARDVLDHVADPR